MIRFSCVCGEKFEVPAECAGDELQCPACRRLVTVPHLGEIDSIADDGTLKLNEAEPNAVELDAKMRAFGYRDDMRRNVDEFLLAGDDEHKPDEPPRRVAPRYDPETGELVTEIGVREDIKRDQPQDIPLATQTLGYSTAKVIEPRAEMCWYDMPWRILTSHSLMAILFVFVAHALIYLGLLLPAFGILFIPLLFAIALTIIAHYCNVIEEFGPHHANHVPVMLRNVSFSEDVLHPLYAVCVSIVFAFGPVIILKICGLGPSSVYPWFWWAAMTYGAFVFLANVFTAVCSGALQNMLPKYALSVIRVAPVRYFLALVLFVVACEAYLLALSRLAFTSPMLLATSRAFPWNQFIITAGVTFAFFAIAIYCMHLSMVWMGFIYRTHYQRLNWIYQRHQKDERNDTNARLAQMRRAGDPRVSGGVRQQQHRRGMNEQDRIAFAREANTQRSFKGEAAPKQINSEMPNS